MSVEWHGVRTKEVMKFFDYTGVIHIHSEYSFDGSTSVADIVKAAEENHIDFLMLTDHGTLMAREMGLEGWHGDTLLIVGQEISPRFNHYLAFQIERAIDLPGDISAWQPQEYIDQVVKQGGFGIIAHPDHDGAPKFHVKHYPWKDWSVSKFDGLGIWDFMTDWQSSLSGYAKALASYLFPAAFLSGPKRETLRRWDTLNQMGRFIGVAECDNHNTRKEIFGFKYLRTHVLLDNPLLKENGTDIAAVCDSLRRGRAYIAHDYLEPATGFSFTLSDGGQVYSMGDELAHRTGMKIDVGLPVQGRIKVLADGTTIYEALAKECSLEVDSPGVYRIEAYLKSWGRFRPWIFSNPIFVRKN